MFRQFDAFSIAGLMITATLCLVVLIAVIANVDRGFC